jgi:hypothetical protein
MIECNKNKFTKISSHRNIITHDSYISYDSYIKGCMRDSSRKDERIYIKTLMIFLE